MNAVTLIYGTLVQESALVVGGAERGPSLVDKPVGRDGTGRLVIPGRGIAGALVAMARRMYAELPPDISADSPESGTEPLHRPSVWRPFHAHPVAGAQGNALWRWCGPDEVKTEYRQGVGIRQDTGARAEHVLYDLECVPAGTRWSFLLEIRDNQEPEAAGARSGVAEAIAVRVLEQWAQGRCWLGGAVARGLGWLRLDQPRLVRTSGELWPNSYRAPEETLAGLMQSRRVEVLDGEALWDVARTAPPTRSWCFLEIQGNLAAGGDPEGYGLDGLAVGASASAGPAATPGRDHLLAPEGLAEAVSDRLWETDRPVAFARHRDGVPRPFIPGSGLRGPLRHALSRELRRRGAQVRDPNLRGDAWPGGLPEELFGTTAQSARLLVRDAYIEGDAWRLARVQHHAEDEFAAGPYGSAKFDNALLVQGTFAWRMVLEGPDEHAVDPLAAGLWSLLGDVGLGHLGHLSVGGLKWRGAGWARWTVTSWQLDRIEPQAGDTGGTQQADAASAAPPSRSGAPRQTPLPATRPSPKGDWSSGRGDSPVVGRVPIAYCIGQVTDGSLTLLAVTRRCAAADAVSWWIEPRADPRKAGGMRPQCFGWGPPPAADLTLDEVRVCFRGGFWRGLRTGASSYRWIHVREVEGTGLPTAKDWAVGTAETRAWPAVLRRDAARFGLSPLQTPHGGHRVRLIEYALDGRTLGFRWEDA